MDADASLESGLELRTKKVSTVSGDVAMLRGHQDIYQVAREGKVDELLSLVQLESLENIRTWVNRLDEKENSPLHYAARYSHAEMAQELVRLGAEVDLLGSDGMTPLHYASRYGRNITEREMSGRTDYEAKDEDPGLDTVRVLVEEKKACVTKADIYSLQPLHHAAMRGHLKVVEFLVKQQAIDLNCQDKQKSTPLHIAATYGHKEVAVILLKAGADCTKLDYKNQNPLHKACEEGNNEVVHAMVEELDKKEKSQEEDVGDGKQRRIGEELKTLLKQKDEEDNTPLLLAVQAGNSDAVGLFIDQTDSGRYINELNKEHEGPLHFASRSGDKRTVELLVNNGAKVNITNQLGETPLHLAVENAKGSGGEKTTELVQFLVERHANLELTDHRGHTAIMRAACGGHTDVVRFLHQRGANLTRVDRNDKTIMHLAALNNRAEVILLLLRAKGGEDLVNTNDQYDSTPLHEACAEGHLESVRVLLDNGADIDNKNEDEQTPFHLAAAAGHIDVVELLLERDQNAIFDKDEDDNSALHLASNERRSKMVELLLRQGASVQQRNNRGWTALDSAAAAGAYECAALLLKHDSPVDPMDMKKTTPLHLTAKYGHARITTLLLQHGANVSLEDVDGRNVLELAIQHRHKAVAEVVINSRDWYRAMDPAHVDEVDNFPDTPMRMLIRVFPDLAEVVFDKCTSREKGVLDLDCKFLDDTHCWKREVGENGKWQYVRCPPNVREPYHPKGEIVKQNHCLMLMAKNRQKHLLKHPLCLGLLRHKWKAFGRYVFYFTFVIYCLFLASITGYTLFQMDELSWPKNGSVPVGPDTAIDKSTPEKLVFGLLVFFFAGLSIALEISQLIRMRLSYFSIANMVDWVIYLFSIGFVFNITMSWEIGEGCEGNICWRWPVGSFILTAAWLNLLTYFQQLPSLGIFILMFRDVGYTMLKFLIIMFVFVIAFGLGFHILFKNNNPFFAYPAGSLVKTFVMMVGELEYEALFPHDPAEAPPPFEYYSNLLFVVFVLAMGIVVMNLLVGLAVDDIQEIQENAELHQLSLNVELVLDLERFFPTFNFCLSTAFLEHYSKQKQQLVLTSGRKGFIGSGGLQDVLSKASITSRLEERAEDGSQNEGTLEMIAERQKELRVALLGMEAQVERLLEEGRETQGALTRLEARGRRTSRPQKYQGAKRDNDNKP